MNKWYERSYESIPTYLVEVLIWVGLKLTFIPSILDNQHGYYTILIVFNINTWCCGRRIELANGMFFTTLRRVLGLNGCIVNAKINCLFNKNF